MTRAELYLMLSEALAAAKPGHLIGNTASDAAAAQWVIDCGHIATALGAHHETFDRDRFLVDCGAQEGPPRRKCSAIPEELCALLSKHVRVCGRPMTEHRLGGVVPDVVRPTLTMVPDDVRADFAAALERDIERAGRQDL